MWYISPNQVTVKGSLQPMGLYTYDCCIEKLKFDPDDPLYEEEPKAFSQSFTSSVVKDPKGNAKIKYIAKTYKNEFEENTDITEVRGFTEEFLSEFRSGFDAYLAGDWQAAKRILGECLVSARAHTTLQSHAHKTILFHSLGLVVIN